jgi:hypothetical protein
MQIDVLFDPCDDDRTQTLFLPVENEHLMDAIARRIDHLLEARMTPNGYKLILEGVIHLIMLLFQNGSDKS